jgi:hypothetical protein
LGEEETLPCPGVAPMPLESPRSPLVLFHFVKTLKKKIKSFVIIFEPGWCET